MWVLFSVQQKRAVCLFYVGDIHKKIRLIEWKESEPTLFFIPAELQQKLSSRALVQIFILSKTSYTHI